MNTQTGQPKFPRVSVPALSLPSGGGSIKNMGETFTPNIFSGTGNYSIPIPVTPARGFEPQLALQYNSGSGNGIFGVGFSVDISSVSRRTEQGIPKYEGNDVYMWNGSELTPLLTPQESGWHKRVRTESMEQTDWAVTSFCMRVEGSFAAIEQWNNLKTDLSFWKTISRNNITSYYGRKPSSRISNPDEQREIFEWLLEESTDEKGNRIVYSYEEAMQSVVSSDSDVRSAANRYISSIQYGNYFDQNGSEQFAFEVVFDYGERAVDDNNLSTDTANPYQVIKPKQERPDAFSRYKSGFEIRTCWLCRHILMFHHFENELGKEPCLVRRTSFTYTEQPEASLLSSLQTTGLRRQENGSYELQHMPLSEFTFSSFIPDSDGAFQTLQPTGSLAGYLDRSQFFPIDLCGEGIAGFLYSNDDAIYYLSPLGDGEYTSPQLQDLFPVHKNIQAAEAVFTDIEGNGKLDLLTRNEVPSASGYYERDEISERWMPFATFNASLTDLNNPDLEMISLAGNGKTDLFLADQYESVCYLSKGKDGYEAAKYVPKQPDFPTGKHAGATELITFTGIFGDGLQHRVRIANGCVEAWPNLGYGRFGQKRTLRNAPLFSDGFDARRLHLADIDGSGTTDIIYAYPDRVELYINQSGNGFSGAITVHLPEPYSEIDKISFADVSGNGTSCLVFTKIQPVPHHYYYEFIGNTLTESGSLLPAMKPYLLTGIQNNMGLAIQLQYCSSVKFYLEDKLSGKPWITKLPFPVQVIEKITKSDLVSGTTLTNAFKYHHGYYDFTEKRFCGFGYIESWDTEVFDVLPADSSSQVLTGKDMYVPPVYTRSWHHTGALLEAGSLASLYQDEYYKGDAEAYRLPDCFIDPSIAGSNGETFRQAIIALKGTAMRQELYGLDNMPERSAHPYTVTESNAAVTLLQPLENQPYGVFLVTPRESVSYHYERNAADPRIQQQFTLATDAYGNITKAGSVFLPRRTQENAVVYPEQQQLKAVVSVTDYANVTDDFRHIGVVYQSRQFELQGLQINAGAYFTYADISLQTEAALLNTVTDGYDIMAATKPTGKLFGWSRLLFWNEEQSDVQPLGSLTANLLLHHTEEAVFTKDFITTAFAGKLTDDIIAREGGYFYDSDTGYYWQRSLVQFYNIPAAFYTGYKTENVFADESSSLRVKTTAEYDAPYYFSVTKTQHWLDEQTCNEGTALIDYITLQPRQFTDANQNTSQVIFDPLGQVIVSSLFGETNGSRTGGMTLYATDGKPAEYQRRSSAANGSAIDLADIISNPDYYLQGAASYFYYNVFAGIDAKTGDAQPTSAVTLVRENHYHNAESGADSASQVSVAYFDGYERTIETKHKGDEGTWIVSGRVVNNNKGKPCRQYLPYFSPTPAYEKQDDATPGNDVPPSILYYDPLLRLTRTDTPKGFFSKVEFTPWETKHFDENDTILESSFYTTHYPDKLSPDEKDAADKAAACYDTPHVQVLDSAGNVFLEIENSIGVVYKDDFAKLTEGTALSPESLWNELVAQGYLETKPMVSGGWLTQKAQPYSKGFSLQLSPPFQSFVKPLLNRLRQGYLVSYHEYDIQGRNTVSTDARLYYANKTQGTVYYNFRYLYTMGGKDPLVSDSADAGKEYHFSNVFGSLVWSWSARNFNQTIRYDRLQRRLQVQVKGFKDDGILVTDNLVEDYTYGETVANAEALNLRGELHLLKDQSGIVTNTVYDIHGKVLQASRQFTHGYNGAINWNDNPALATDLFTEEISYDALERVVAKTTPDGSITSHTYKQSGELDTITVAYSDGTHQPIITGIAYDAKGQRTKVSYANGMSTSYTYESTTLRLAQLRTTRPAGNAKGKTQNGVLQNIIYTYDAVGNITRIKDNSFATVFSSNQAVKPLSDYTYDALYRLVKATGRQHPGIAGNTFINNAQNGDCKQTKYMPLANDATKLENYIETYAYDAGGNLTRMAHRAANSWTRQFTMVKDGNRLQTITTGDASQDMTYDRSGNQRLLYLNSAVDLTWSCCENLANAGIIQRPSEMDDREYYTYDSGEMRTRKVSERMAQGGTLTGKEEKLYFRNYEVKTIGTIAGNKETVVVKRQTLRVMDGDACVAMMHYWVTDDGKREAEGTGTRKLRYQLDNHLGSVSLEVDDAARVISYEEYFPYGGTAFIAGDNMKEVSLKEYRYSGKERDDSTGLYYYGARYYAPWLGRWLSADPAGRVDGMNVYAFVGGNPINHYDYLGFAIRRPRSSVRHHPYLSSGSSSSSHSSSGSSSHSHSSSLADRAPRYHENSPLNHDISYLDSLARLLHTSNVGIKKPDGSPKKNAVTAVGYDDHTQQLLISANTFDWKNGVFTNSIKDKITEISNYIDDKKYETDNLIKKLAKIDGEKKSRGLYGRLKADARKIRFHNIDKHDQTQLMKNVHEALRKQKFEIVENQDLHAELPLINRLKDKVGVNKLSCIHCYEYIEKQYPSVPLRGTHGMGYKGWRDPDSRRVRSDNYDIKNKSGESYNSNPNHSPYYDRHKS